MTFQTRSTMPIKLNIPQFTPVLIHPVTNRQEDTPQREEYVNNYWLKTSKFKMKNSTGYMNNKEAYEYELNSRIQHTIAELNDEWNTRMNTTMKNL